MNYKDYQIARDSVWRLLIDLGISELPINTVKVCAELGIKLHYYEPDNESDGMSCYINGVPHIFVSSAVSPERRTRYSRSRREVRACKPRAVTGR